jgi:hypothetical protein
MEPPITASACCKKLKENLDYDCKADYFSKLVSEGRFPIHSKPNSPKKFFKYTEVESVVKTFSTVAQSKPVSKKEYEDDSLLAQVGKFPSLADMSPEEKQTRLEQEAFARDEAKAQAQEAGVDVDNPDLDDEDLTDSTEFFGKTLNEVKIQKEFWLGKKAEIEYKKQMKEVVSIDEVNKNAFEIARSMRDSLTGMSARLTAMVASENDPHVIRTMIDEEVNRTLTSLSEEIYE